LLLLMIQLKLLAKKVKAGGTQYPKPCHIISTVAVNMDLPLQHQLGLLNQRSKGDALLAMNPRHLRIDCSLVHLTLAESVRANMCFSKRPPLGPSLLRRFCGD
jgi:hypothetical protein